MSNLIHNNNNNFHFLFKKKKKVELSLSLFYIYRERDWRKLRYITEASNENLKKKDQRTSLAFISMAPRKTQTVGYTGYIEAMPSKQISTNTPTGSRGRQLRESTELKCASKSIYKDIKGKSTTNFKQSYIAGEFLDKSSGRLGYKEEMQYSRMDKYDNKAEGYTHEYETQVKFKHVAYPTKSTGSSNSENKQITFSSHYDYDCDY